MSKIKGLDTLRAFAVFLVIMQHLGVWYNTSSSFGLFIHDVIIPDGGFGVLLFFVLSGFLITSILLDAKRAGENTNHFFTLKNFFIRRALRIFPIYYLLLFILFLADYPDVRQHIGYFATYTSNILCYRTHDWNGLSHTWSLAIEEQFYLVWPWLILFIKDKYLKYLFIIAIITGIVSTHITLAGGHAHPFLVYNFFDAFGIGGFYAFIRLEPGTSMKYEKAIKVIALVSLPAYFYWKTEAYLNQPSHFIFMIKTVNATIAIGLIIEVINNKSARVKKYLLENRFLNYMGKISYGIYLYHYVYNVALLKPVNDFLNKATAHHPTLNKIALDNHYIYWVHVAIIILISTLSYKLIEKPLLNLKRFFKYTK